MLNAVVKGKKKTGNIILMRKERKCFSFYNSFCEITAEPSSKISTSFPLRIKLYPGNFHIPIWIKSLVFVSASERYWAIVNHILQQNCHLQMYFYPLSHTTSWGRVEEWFSSGFDTILSFPREHLKQKVSVCMIPALVSRDTLHWVSALKLWFYWLKLSLLVWSQITT